MSAQIVISRTVRGWGRPGRVVVTPRTSNRARGVTAEEVLIDRELLTDDLVVVAGVLLGAVLPCLVTAAAPRIWINSYPVRELTFGQASALADDATAAAKGGEISRRLADLVVRSVP